MHIGVFQAQYNVQGYDRTSCTDIDTISNAYSWNGCLLINGKWFCVAGKGVVYWSTYQNRQIRNLTDANWPSPNDDVMTVRKINENPETSTGISTQVCCCLPAAATKKRNHPSSLRGEFEQPKTGRDKAGAFETLFFLGESEIHRANTDQGAAIGEVQLQVNIDAIWTRVCNSILQTNR